MKAKRIFGFVVVISIIFLFGSGQAIAKTWYVPKNFLTIQAAIDSPNVQDSDTIVVGNGNFAGAIVRKAVEIKAIGCKTTINDGPLPWGDARPFKAGFLFEGSGVGSGAKISGFRFKNIQFPVFSRGANSVAVKCCVMLNSIQGITNWHGQGWQIDGNFITDLQTSNGGGIGIFCGGVWQDWQDIIKNNIILNNKISGVLHVMSGDGGGYNGSGIVLYADFRWGAPGPKVITCNLIMDNMVAMKSDTPSVVGIAAIELSDTRDVPDLDVIYGNTVVFNDLRKTALKIDLTPDDLNQVNLIYCNAGVADSPVTTMVVESLSSTENSAPKAKSMPFFD